MVKSPFIAYSRREHIFGKVVMSVLGLVIVGVFFGSTIDLALIRGGGAAAVISAVLVDLANGDRTTNTLTPLATSPVLTAAAQAKANDMAEKGYFAHIAPDGKDSWYWFRKVGYTFTEAGENLAVDFSDSVDVERAWMNSPTHRANILNGRFTEIGIAVATGTYQGRATVFVAQMFGKPAPQNTVATIQKASLPRNPTVPAIATATTTKAPKPPTVTPARIATTTPVLGTSAEGLTAPASVSWVDHILASPKTALLYSFYLVALLVIFALLFAVGFEWERHHIRHVKIALGLLALMAALFLFASQYIFTIPSVTSFAL